MKAHRFALWIVLFTLVPLDGPAKTYLTLEQALALAFDQPSNIERHELKWSLAQQETMEKKLDEKISRKSIVVYTGIMKSEKSHGIAVFDSVIGKHELIDYMIFMGNDGKIRWIEILSYRESYGGQIRNRGWRDQFKGSSAAQLPEPHRDISNISGATLSCRHVTEGVKRLLVILSFFRKELNMDTDIP
jgi:hypothetical protein